MPKKIRWVPTLEQIDKMRTMAESGASRKDIALEIGIGDPVVKREMDKHGIATRWTRTPDPMSYITIPTSEDKNSPAEADEEWVSPAKRFRSLYR